MPYICWQEWLQTLSLILMLAWWQSRGATCQGRYNIRWLSYCVTVWQILQHDVAWYPATSIFKILISTIDMTTRTEYHELWEVRSVVVILGFDCWTHNTLEITTPYFVEYFLTGVYNVCLFAPMLPQCQYLNSNKPDKGHPSPAIVYEHASMKCLGNCTATKLDILVSSDKLYPNISVHQRYGHDINVVDLKI